LPLNYVPRRLLMANGGRLRLSNPSIFKLDHVWSFLEFFRPPWNLYVLFLFRFWSPLLMEPLKVPFDSPFPNVSACPIFLLSVGPFLSVRPFSDRFKHRRWGFFLWGQWLRAGSGASPISPFLFCIPLFSSFGGEDLRPFFVFLDNRTSFPRGPLRLSVLTGTNPILPRFFFSP